MTKHTHLIVKQFLQDLGFELKRVREQQNLTIEQAAELAGINKPNVVDRTEHGKKNLIIKAVRLINAYHQKVIIRLEDKSDD